MVDVLASLGIVSVAVGFAFKDVLENVLAEVLLLLRDPFKSGDEIRVGEHEGTVEGVTIRETLPRTPAGQRVLLPNAQVYTSALEVLTHCPATWITFAVVLDVAADLDQATPVMQTALRAVEEVVSDPAPQVVVTDLGVGTVTPECRPGPRRTGRRRPRPDPILGPGDHAAPRRAPGRRLRPTRPRPQRTAGHQRLRHPGARCRPERRPDRVRPTRRTGHPGRTQPRRPDHPRPRPVPPRSHRRGGLRRLGGLTTNRTRVARPPPAETTPGPCAGCGC
jgi:hypothetical protein